MGFKTLRICPQAVHELTVAYGPADGWKDCIQSETSYCSSFAKGIREDISTEKSDGLQEGSIPSF